MDCRFAVTARWRYSACPQAPKHRPCRLATFAVAVLPHEKQIDTLACWQSSRDVPTSHVPPFHIPFPNTTSSHRRGRCVRECFDRCGTRLLSVAVPGTSRYGANWKTMLCEFRLNSLGPVACGAACARTRGSDNEPKKKKMEAKWS